MKHFGKILVQFKNHEVDLSDILVRQKVAIYDEKAFMKGCFLLSINFIPHMTISYVRNNIFQVLVHFKIFYELIELCLILKST